MNISYHRPMSNCIFYIHVFVQVRRSRCSRISATASCPCTWPGGSLSPSAKGNAYHVSNILCASIVITLRFMHFSKLFFKKWTDGISGLYNSKRHVVCARHNYMVPAFPGPPFSLLARLATPQSPLLPRLATPLKARIATPIPPLLARLC